MDFWAHQEDARRRTVRLVALYCVLMAVFSLLAGYALDLVWQGFVEGREPSLTALLLQPRPYCIALGFLALVGLLCQFSPASLSAGGKSVAESLRGTLVTPQTTNPGERRLMNVVEEMALASGMPVPPVYILKNESGINAFAAGGTINDAVIGVTRGTVDLLDRDELQAVIGHEFSHILNGDMKLDLRFVKLLFGLMCLADFCGAVMHGLSRGSHRSRGGRDRNKGLAFLLLLVLIVYLAGLVMAFMGSVIQAAVNRQREYLADASSVQFTRSDALASALKKIGGLSRGGSLTATPMTASYRHLFFCSIHSGLFSTHPPLETRIRRIDPRWDGKFPRLEPGGRVVDDDFEPASPGPSSGKLTANRAEDLLRQACRDPLDASRVVLALLLDEKETIRKQQLGFLADGTAAQRVREYRTAVETLPGDTFLPLVELAIPALKNFSAGQFAAYRRTLENVIHADGVFSFREWAVYQLIISQAGAQFTPLERSRPGSETEAAATVLSALARLAPDGGKARRAFDAGSKILAATVSFHTDTLDPGDLSASIAVLAASSPGQKKTFMRAAAAVVTHDSRIDPEETVFLRILSLCLGAPVPPLSIGAENDPWTKYRSR